ncbi:MAG: formylglycine-generating enzyme family protein [Opitutaceae bacterium]|jgi:formylglycine-generating enzyme required for sulfatase activity|nr:formylglycine-generating enzyme family protein [Opitutaceae bacterium]
MKTNKSRRAPFLAATLATTLTAVAATTAWAIEIETVPVGNPGNAANGNTGLGAVSYEYQIGKYAVTNEQYTAFLNAVARTDTYGLYSSGMNSNYAKIIREGDAGTWSYTVAAGWEKKAVVYVGFYDALRFVNWLTNGQPTGVQDTTTTESGMYVLDGKNTLVAEASHTAGNGWVIPDQDEWHKAAYYNGDGTYRLYPVMAEELNRTMASYWIPDGADGLGIGGLNPGGTVIADVDYFDATPGANSYYGTFQQGGNVYEWSDTPDADADASKRLMWGGAYLTGVTELYSDASPHSRDATSEQYFTGFRVVNLAALASVPEPATFAALAGLALLAFAVWRRRSGSDER